MLAPEMRTLRALYAQKHLLRSPTLKLTPPISLISFKNSPKPHHFRLHRQIHSTFHRCSSDWATSFPFPQTTDSENNKTENSPSTTVSTFYDPITGDITTHAGAGPAIAPSTSDDEENNPKLSTLHYQADERSEPVNGRGNKGRVFRRVGKTNQSLADRIKKRKVKTEWVCTECGYSDGQWWGSCRSCKRVGTMKEFSVAEPSVGGKISGFQASENIVQSWLGPQSAEADPVRLTNVNKGMLQSDWRIPLSGLFGTEVARVLGGGLVPGSLVLIGGDPGVGKSTLVLQIGAMIAEGYDIGQPAPVVYVSGEESIEQIKNRADRMKIGTDELYLYSSTDIEDILDKSQRLSPRALIIDSIQTVFLRGVTGSAGSLSQVKECTSALLRFAKKTNIPVFLIGHVTKSGDIAGPRVLEHIVDAVLYMEGERYSSHRMLRSIKNRFGSTDELGVFDMSQAGLQAVLNPSEMFLGEQVGDSEVLAGLAVAVIMDGSRTFLIEIQALCVAGAQISAQVNGMEAGKANMIIAVLMKQAGLKLQANAVFLNVVSGVTLTETAGDLAVAAAICSSFLEFPIPNGLAFIGEIGLGGELRMVPRMEKRVMTVVKLGYKKCIVPKSAEGSLSGVELKGLEIVACRNLKEVINTVFIMQR